MDFEKANAKEHPVETQWHYPIMTKAGFVSKTPVQTGFVRTYEYEHPDSKVVVVATTGVNADYWNNKTTGDGGYHNTLEAHVSPK